jgi:hypothetical protein
MNNITDTVKHLIIINIIFYIGTALFGDLLYGWFSLWFPKNEHFGIWQFVTHNKSKVREVRKITTNFKKKRTVLI